MVFLLHSVDVQNTYWQNTFFLFLFCLWENKWWINWGLFYVCACLYIRAALISLHCIFFLLNEINLHEYLKEQHLKFIHKWLNVLIHFVPYKIYESVHGSVNNVLPEKLFDKKIGIDLINTNRRSLKILMVKNLLRTSSWFKIYRPSCKLWPPKFKSRLMYSALVA